MADGVPDRYGEYAFILKDGEKVYGKYGSYAFPYGVSIKVANFESEDFYYIPEDEIVGYSSILNQV